MGCKGRNGGLRDTTGDFVSQDARPGFVGLSLALSMTFSSEFGQSIAKQTKIRSVSG